MSYLKRHGTRRVPQWAPLPGQAPNSAGGFAWTADMWTRLRRFLVLGSEGGSYYASEWKLTRENAQAVEECVREDGQRAVAEIVRVSTEGRAPKNDPALYRACAGGGPRRRRDAAGGARGAAAGRAARVRTCSSSPCSSRASAAGAVRSVARSAAGTRPRRWMRSPTRRSSTASATGVTHRDLLRLAHPARRVGAGNPVLDISDEHARLFEWIVRGGDADGLPRLVEGFVRAQEAATPRGGRRARPRVPPAA